MDEFALAAAIAQKHDGRAAVKAALARKDCTAAVLNNTLWTGPAALPFRETVLGTGRKPGEALAVGDTVALAPGATGVEGLGVGEVGEIMRYYDDRYSIKNIATGKWVYSGVKKHKVVAAFSGMTALHAAAALGRGGACAAILADARFTGNNAADNLAQAIIASGDGGGDDGGAAAVRAALARDDSCWRSFYSPTSCRRGARTPRSLIHALPNTAVRVASFH